MKLTVMKDLVEFVPENDQEAKDLNGLWRVVVDCVAFNKKLVAVGEYIPEKGKVARFAIEE